MNQELPGALAVAMGIAEQRWPHTVDATKWADEWLKAMSADPSIAADRATMVAWFSNAIMAGYDTAVHRRQPEGHTGPACDPVL